MSDWVIPDKETMKDPVSGNFLTQALFLEIFYEPEVAIYSLSDYDKVYDGKLFPSIRKFYLAANDPTEWEFADKYFYNWDHWCRIKNNCLISRKAERWAEELEVKLRSQAVKRAIGMGDKNFNAAKWASDGGWNTKRGRPSKAELEREKKIREKVSENLETDGDRILQFVRKESNG